MAYFFLNIRSKPLPLFVCLVIWSPCDRGAWAIGHTLSLSLLLFLWLLHVLRLGHEQGATHPTPNIPFQWWSHVMLKTMAQVSQAHPLTHPLPQFLDHYILNINCRCSLNKSHSTLNNMVDGLLVGGRVLEPNEGSSNAIVFFSHFSRSCGCLS